jgi:Tol biopolymer transport system component
VLILSYDPHVFDHPRDLNVRLRLMDMDGGNLTTLFELFGGQGTINVPNWSPNGYEFAYVRYFPVSA